jgi:glucose/arabinose dehydrogenase
MENARLRGVLGIAVFAGALAGATPAVFAATSLRFHGNGSGDIDRVKVPIDDPANANAGPPADVGAADFTLEFWMKAAAADNPAGSVPCGANVDWINGNIVVDRDRFGLDRKFGVSVAGGTLVFGVSGDGTGDLTICGSRPALDSSWHHVAVDRRRSDGRMRIWVDGILDAEADGPDGDVSYPDDATPAASNDPFLVFGAEKHDAGVQFPSYDGFLDEIRVSTVLRYTSPFTRPNAPFAADGDTVALYRLDEGTGDLVADVSGAAGGPSHGQRQFGGSPAGPEWSTDVPPLGGTPAITFTLITNAVDQPVQVTHAPNDASRLFIVEQGGTIRIWEDGALRPRPFLDIASLTSDGSEQGLLSMAFDPDYGTSGLFYIYYTDDIGNPGDITLARYAVSADPDVADAGSAEILLVIPHPVEGNHNGGQLAFSPVDGYLYMGTGDGGSGGDPPNNAQNLNVLLGKMLRLDVNGTGRVPCNQSTPQEYSVPPSNPFVGETGCDEIWSYGLRNPWRFTFDRETGDMLIGDVGQNAWEELDYQPGDSEGGENWGWRLMEGNHCYNPGSGCDDGSLVHPILEYDHGQGCSVTGGFRYRGSAIPGLYGLYLYADFCTGRIWLGTQAGNGTWSSTQLLDSGYNISGWGEDAAGEVYLAHHGGSVYKLTPTPNPVPATTSMNPTVAIAGDPGFTLTVDGSGFAFNSVVRWNGEDRPTTFVSAAQVTAAIPASDILAAGSAQVTVFSPGPGGGLSAPRAFDINLTFLDVPNSNFAYLHIQAIFDAGVTAGCGPRIFCPAVSTTRAQMAVFLLKASEGASYVPPPCTGAFFDDVDCVGNPFDPWIEDLASKGITGGCGGGNYCPGNPVTRAQMSAFLLKTDQGAAYVPPTCTGTVFLDVPCSGLFDAWIEDLAARGITGGCGGGNYCPALAVTRAQMSIFLVLTFEIPLP